MDNTKLPLTVWFLAIYLISQAKTGISSLAFKRQLGVSYPTAWLLHQKINRAMAAQDATHRLAGAVQLDDAYLGGERVGGKVGRGSKNKVPFVAAVSLNSAGHPLYLKLALVSGFTSRRSVSGPKPALHRAPASWATGSAALLPSPTPGVCIFRRSSAPASPAICQPSSGSTRCLAT